MTRIIAFLTLLSTASASSQFVVTGKVLGPNGLPLPLAEIRTGRNAGDSMVTKADANGHFRLVLPSGEPKNLFVNSGNKGGSFVPLLTELDDSIAFVIQLDSVSKVDFADPISRTARFARLHLNLSQKYLDFIQSLQKLQRDGADTKSFFHAWTDTATEIKQMVVAEKDPVIQGELLLRYYRLTSIHGMQFDTLFYRKIATSIPASSPLWFFNNYEAFDQSSLLPEGEKFVDTMISIHPSRELRAFLLFERARNAQYAMNENEVRRNYEILKMDFGDIWWSRIADQWIVVNMKIKRGAPIPDFSFNDMDDSTLVYSASSLKGSVFLLDFWATWCLPCIGEMPYLQKAYEKYHSRGLQIISISSDADQSDVQKFRTQKVQMPWKHVWIPGNNRKTIHDQFEVTGIPKPILVDRNGEIVGLKSDVRGEDLEKALEKLFGK